jgi:hypothetical protein
MYWKIRFRVDKSANSPISTIRIDADSNDSFFIATQIAEHAKTKGYDIILTGKDSVI